jgi:hypothetical protein
LRGVIVVTESTISEKVSVPHFYHALDERGPCREGGHDPSEWLKFGYSWSQGFGYIILLSFKYKVFLIRGVAYSRCGTLG